MTVLGIDTLKDAVRYLRENPAYLFTSLGHAVRQEIGIPMEALRWLAGQYIRGPKAPKEFSLSAAPPALGIAATVNVMGAELRVRSNLHIDEVVVDAGTLRIALRLRDLGVKAPDGSPLQQMLGVMDLSKPGNLVGFLPQRPPLLVEARDDRFVLDLMKLPKLAANHRLQRILAAVGEVLRIRQVRVEPEVGEGLLVISLSLRPRGLPAALAALRS